MRRGLQGIEQHTDCTCRVILGRRNRYALCSAPRNTRRSESGAARRFVLDYGGSFPLIHTDTLFRLEHSQESNNPSYDGSLSHRTQKNSSGRSGCFPCRAYRFRRGFYARNSQSEQPYIYCQATLTGRSCHALTYGRSSIFQILQFQNPLNLFIHSSSKTMLPPLQKTT